MEWVKKKRANGERFVLLVFEAASDIGYGARLATWRNLIDLVCHLYPSTATSMEHCREVLERTPFADVEAMLPPDESNSAAASGTDELPRHLPTFRSIKDAGHEDPRFATAENISPGGALCTEEVEGNGEGGGRTAPLWAVRGFLYNAIGVKELYSGDGSTRLEDGVTPGLSEYLAPNVPVAELLHCRVIDLFAEEEAIDIEDHFREKRAKEREKLSFRVASMAALAATASLPAASPKEDAGTAPPPAPATPEQQQLERAMQLTKWLLTFVMEMEMEPFFSAGNSSVERRQHLLGHTEGATLRRLQEDILAASAAEAAEAAAVALAARASSPQMLDASSASGAAAAAPAAAVSDSKIARLPSGSNSTFLGRFFRSLLEFPFFRDPSLGVGEALLELFDTLPELHVQLASAGGLRGKVVKSITAPIYNATVAEMRSHKGGGNPGSSEAVSGATPASATGAAVAAEGVAADGASALQASSPRLLFKAAIRGLMGFLQQPGGERRLLDAVISSHTVRELPPVLRCIFARHEDHMLERLKRLFAVKGGRAKFSKVPCCPRSAAHCCFLTAQRVLPCHAHLPGCMNPFLLRQWYNLCPRRTIVAMLKLHAGPGLVRQMVNLAFLRPVGGKSMFARAVLDSINVKEAESACKEAAKELTPAVRAKLAAYVKEGEGNGKGGDAVRKRKVSRSGMPQQQSLHESQLNMLLSSDVGGIPPLSGHEFEALSKADFANMHAYVYWCFAIFSFLAFVNLC